MSKKNHFDFEYNSHNNNKTSGWICLKELLQKFYEWPSLLHGYNPHFLKRISFFLTAPCACFQSWSSVFFAKLGTEMHKAGMCLLCWFCDTSTYFPGNEKKITIMLIIGTNKSKNDIDSKLAISKPYNLQYIKDTSWYGEIMISLILASLLIYLFWGLWHSNLELLPDRHTLIGYCS